MSTAIYQTRCWQQFSLSCLSNDAGATETEKIVEPKMVVAEKLSDEDRHTKKTARLSSESLLFCFLFCCLRERDCRKMHRCPAEFFICCRDLQCCPAKRGMFNDLFFFVCPLALVCLCAMPIRDYN